jgi:hypothetical protein
MTEKFLREDKNGTRWFLETVTCPRCGGAGRRPEWALTGWECFECNGRGLVEREVPRYTPEYQAKLEARRQKYAEQREREAAEAERIAQEKREAEKREREARDAEAERKAKADPSRFIGAEGDKIERDVTLESAVTFPCRDVFGRESSRNVYTFRDADQNIIVWFTSAWIEDVYKGKAYRIKATVKEHKVYRMLRQTIVARLKVVA